MKMHKRYVKLSKGYAFLCSVRYMDFYHLNRNIVVSSAKVRRWLSNCDYNYLGT